MNSIESELIESFKNDDVKSFELLFKAYYVRLCLYARSFVHDDMVAGDLVKDIFVILWQNRKNTVITLSFSAYLYRSVHNQCINYITREGKKLSMFEHNLEDSVLKGDCLAVSTDYPYTSLLSKELEINLEKAVQKLPEQCREIFTLSRFENLSHQQIAEKLNISINTIKVQIYRALKKIREELKEFIVYGILLIPNL